MSDFMPQDILSDLWEEILKLHWTYLETEESIQKLEERKKLEGRLKEFLCMVQHDRKFFLPETALVLKNSIRELKEDFNIHNAIVAFESISQYANNLFTKPWRKEFRILKMYSGFFQHEIKSNLIDAEKLFEAMGYRRLSDDTLILDGPICPDQVTNVSRDAMAAYVELQIMKNIYNSLHVHEITSSWLDIFRCREKHVGGISQAVKDLVYAAEEKRYRSREKALAGDNYGYIDVQPSSNYVTQPPTRCQCGVPYHQIQQPPRQRMSNGPPCCIHDLQRNHSNALFGNMNYPTHNCHNQTGLGNDSASHLPHMSHSRSLEHYSEPTNIQHQHTMLPHRHSFDHQQQGCTSAVHHQHHMSQQQQRLHHALQQQQQYYRNPAQNFYESPYDCIEENSLGGGSSISYAAVAASGGGGASTVDTGSNYNINSATYSNPYNVSGNRIPLPFNISNQLSSYDTNSTYVPAMDSQMYAQVSKIPQNYVMNSSAAMPGHNMPSKQMTSQNIASLSSTKDATHRQQHQYMANELIDFEDPPIIPPPSAAQFDPYAQQYHQELLKNKRYNKMAEAEMNIPVNYKQTRDAGNFINNPTARDDMYVYAKPIPKDNRQPHKNPQNSVDKSYASQRALYTTGGDTTDMSYESANDDFSIIPRHQQHQQHSPTQFTKNQDGVGSFESWNYVFKNLERSGYTKDLGEREDLLVKSLDLDSMNITNDSTTPSQNSSVDKRKSIYRENDNNQQIAAIEAPPLQQQQQQFQTKQKSRVFEASSSSLSSKKQDANTSPPSNSNTNNKHKPQLDNNKQTIKPALKQSSATANTNAKQQHTNSNKKVSNLPKANDNKSKTNNNDNNNSAVSANNKQNKKSSSSAINSVRKSADPTIAASPNAAFTQIVVTGSNEWSCSFCTFINPDTQRICEICCRTKDNNLNSASSSGATVSQPSSVTHTTPTCV